MSSIFVMAPSSSLQLDSACRAYQGRPLSGPGSLGKNSLGRASFPHLRNGQRGQQRALGVRAIASDPKLGGASNGNSILGSPAELAQARILPSADVAGGDATCSGEDEEAEVLRRGLLQTRAKLADSEGALREALSRIESLESRTEAASAVLDAGERAQLGANEVNGRQTQAAALATRPAHGVDGRREGGSVPGGKALKTSGRVEQYPESLKQFWYPVAFSRHVDSTTLVPIECFSEPWVIFRGADGQPGCLRDECAHRACPLSLGTVVDGRVACAYHGWEFSTKGNCVKMPSTKCTRASVSALPCMEKDGMIWIWPSEDSVPPPDSDSPDSEPAIPGTLPPSHYVIHAELVMELPVEYGLLVENLLDLAHAPFTHTSTFARGWSVPNLVRFKTAATMQSVLKGHWDPYPIAMEFRPPCVVVSTIGLAKPGKLEGGQTAQECTQHLFQMHACVPSSPGKTRLLYRMGLDFAAWVKHVPFINRLWTYLAGQVLDEDLRLVIGQQDRMHRGANVWNHPVNYDKLGVGFRRWRNSVEARSSAET